jgi:hypothetical protein
LSYRFRRRAAALGLRTNPAFAGTYEFDDAADFAALFPRFLERLPDGSVVMCHPGFVVHLGLPSIPPFLSTTGATAKGSNFATASCA